MDADEPIRVGREHRDEGEPRDALADGQVEGGVPGDPMPTPTTDWPAKPAKRSSERALDRTENLQVRQSKSDSEEHLLLPEAARPRLKLDARESVE